MAERRIPAYRGRVDDHDARVVLRPVAEDDLPFLERLRTDPDLAGPFLWQGWSDAGRFRRRWDKDRYQGGDAEGADSGLIVADAAGPVGYMSYRRVDTAPPVWCWSIGIQLLPEARGRGVGARAQRLLVEYLFAHTLAHRIQAETDVDNIAEQRALESIGFTREGVIRAYSFLGGRYHDEVLYSILREEAAPGGNTPSPTGDTV